MVTMESFQTSFDYISHTTNGTANHDTSHDYYHVTSGPSCDNGATYDHESQLQVEPYDTSNYGTSAGDSSIRAPYVGDPYVGDRGYLGHDDAGTLDILPLSPFESSWHLNLEVDSGQRDESLNMGIHSHLHYVPQQLSSMPEYELEDTLEDSSLSEHSIDDPPATYSHFTDNVPDIASMSLYDRHEGIQYEYSASSVRPKQKLTKDERRQQERREREQENRAAEAEKERRRRRRKDKDPKATASSEDTIHETDHYSGDCLIVSALYNHQTTCAICKHMAPSLGTAISVQRPSSLRCL
ncbi:hypothetical protein QBC34DRAFT_417844 [Podospora aff. communis PSN243]|uniref:BZIP domain-containing protein n=1 Tax=Podospora aff. communis PSN243 TaxID=3040156 RepID=A0AAV9G4G5_9PEZI|nr:hypothetical protein QBC34DRAFT_417844 [Podospora aff. communis PSN243]